MLIHLCKQATQRSAPRDFLTRGRGAVSGFWAFWGDLTAARRMLSVHRRAHPQPYAYSTLMVFVLPLRPLMMPPVMMTLSPFSSCITFRLTCSAW